MDNSYAVLADARRRELKTRIVVAAMVAAAAFAITPTWGPSAWLAAVVVSQLIDTANTRAMRGAARTPPGPRAEWASVGVYTFVNQPIDPRELAGALAEAARAAQVSRAA